MIWQNKTSRVFNLLAKQKVDEKPLQDFFMANAPSKYLRGAKYSWLKGTELSIECDEAIRLNTLCDELNKEGARKLIHVLEISVADNSNKAGASQYRNQQGRVGLEKTVQDLEEKKAALLNENTRLTEEAQQLHREAQERAVVEAQERAVAERELRAALGKAQERAVEEAELRAVEAEEELRDQLQEEAQELHARIKKLEEEAAKNADVGSKRARGGGDEALLSGVMAMLEQSAFRERDAAVKAADERVADALRERGAALQSAGERVADALGQRDAAVKDAAKAVAKAEAKAKDAEAFAATMKKQRDAASDRQRKASSVITAFLDAMDIEDPAERQHALASALHTAAKLRGYINTYNYDGIGGLPPPPPVGRPRRQGNLNSFIVVEE